VLTADESHGAGMLVQKLPRSGATDEEASDSMAVDEAWEGAQRGMAQIHPSRLSDRSIEELLAQGFPGRDLRLFRGAPVRFECRCSEGRVTGLLRALGPEEVREVLREQGSVTVTCEFCHHPYHFDPAAIEALFANGAGLGGSESIH
jgi:molecular chaperone Hsp33